LAAIAASNVFGIKVVAGIILPLPLIVMMTGRGVGAGGEAGEEAVGAGGSTAIWTCWRSLVASQCCFTCFPARDHPFFSLRSPELEPEAAGLSSLDFPFQEGE